VLRFGDEMEFSAIEGLLRKKLGTAGWSPCDAGENLEGLETG